MSYSYRNQATTSEDHNYYDPAKTIQTPEERAVDKAIAKLTWFETQNFVCANLGKLWSLFTVWCCCTQAVVLEITSHNIWKSEQICSTHTWVLWRHAERHTFRKLLCLPSQYGQHSWEELKWSVAPIQCSCLHSCLLSKSDSSPKVRLYMLHMHDMINLPFSGNTRLAVFVLHSLCLHLSDWKNPSWILWP